MPGEPADDRDRDRDAGRGGQEVLHGQGAHQGQVGIVVSPEYACQLVLVTNDRGVPGQHG